MTRHRNSFLWIIESALAIVIIVLLFSYSDNPSIAAAPTCPCPAIEPLSLSQPMPIPKPYVIKELEAKGFYFSDTPPAVRPLAHIDPAGSFAKTTPVNFVILCDPLVRQSENHYLQTCTVKAGE